MKDYKAPDPSEVSDDTMLRLGVAASLAFPAGGITASSLRREATRGRLEIWLIAGKQFTTLGAIKRMRDLCRQPARDQRSDADQDGAALTSRDALLARLERMKAEDVQQREAARAARKSERPSARARR